MNEYIKVEITVATEPIRTYKMTILNPSLKYLNVVNNRYSSFYNNIIHHIQYIIHNNIIIIYNNNQ
jgi:hypothetical protein